MLQHSLYQHTTHYQKQLQFIKHAATAVPLTIAAEARLPVAMPVASGHTRSSMKDPASLPEDTC